MTREQRLRELVEKCSGQGRAAFSYHEGAQDAMNQCATELEAILNEESEGWLPIESAPKDGTMFLCWVKAERHTSIDGESSSYDHHVSAIDFGWFRDMPTGGFYDNAMGQIGDYQDVTHWQPLPAAPTRPADGSEK